MKDQIRTLIFHASGNPRWERVVADTLRSTLRVEKILDRSTKLIPDRWRYNKYFRVLSSDGYRHLSYVGDWKDAWCENTSLKIDLCNINNWFEFRASLRKIKEYSLLVILHSAAGDNLTLLQSAVPFFQERRGQLITFFGNEYMLMPEKIQFAQQVGANFIASQLPIRAAEWVYSDCPTAKIILAPPALNPKVYRPQPGPRVIDIGFRGELYSYAIGDVERTRLLRYVAEHATRWSFVTDIKFSRAPRDEWAKFLSTCHGIVGAEAGTYFLEKDDSTQNSVHQYLTNHPEASFEDVYRRFFETKQTPMTGKAISSRHFEPIGTKTCQILLEGEYNHILVPDKHFISVKKDLSNLDEAMRRFQDNEFRQMLVDETYQYVLDHHTYRHRVEAILSAIN